MSLNACANTPRQGGHGQLSVFVEQSLCLKFRFQGLESSAQLSFTRVLHTFDDHLVVAACLVNADLAENQHIVAVLQVNRRATLPLSKPGTAKLGG